MIKFERVSKYPDAVLPKRATAQSAGYDFCVAEDIIIPSYAEALCLMQANTNYHKDYTLEEMKTLVKGLIGPTLVPTGIKCILEPDTYLKLAVRSSLPLNSWLILANGVGIVDADYASPSNPSEGHIQFQLINLAPVQIQLKKGDRIGQGIIHRYLTTDDDSATGNRVGGFGSTSK